MHEKDNYLKTAELSTEQNCNMIDGVPTDSGDTVLKTDFLQRKGFYALPVRPPTVPEGTSRIRFSLTADITEEEIKSLIELI